MFEGRKHQTQTQPPHFKTEEKKYNNYQEMVTAVKKTEGRQICTQETPRPQKKILLLDQMNHKHLFPLVRDREVGIATKYQHVVIQSYNDDDRQTSSTQMQRGMIQTLEDLYERVDEYDSSQN